MIPAVALARRPSLLDLARMNGGVLAAPEMGMSGMSGMPGMIPPGLQRRLPDTVLNAVSPTRTQGSSGFMQSLHDLMGSQDQTLGSILKKGRL